MYGPQRGLVQNLEWSAWKQANNQKLPSDSFLLTYGIPSHPCMVHNLDWSAWKQGVNELDSTIRFVFSHISNQRMAHNVHQCAWKQGNNPMLLSDSFLFSFGKTITPTYRPQRGVVCMETRE